MANETILKNPYTTQLGIGLWNYDDSNLSATEIFPSRYGVDIHPTAIVHCTGLCIAKFFGEHTTLSLDDYMNHFPGAIVLSRGNRPERAIGEINWQSAVFTQCRLPLESSMQHLVDLCNVPVLLFRKSCLEGVHVLPELVERYYPAIEQ